MAYGFVLTAITLLLLGRAFLAAPPGDTSEDTGQNLMCDGTKTVIVGNNSEREMGATKAEMSDSKTTLYLDYLNPAPCSGNITSWTFCYYTGDHRTDGDDSDEEAGKRRRRRSDNMPTPKEDRSTPTTPSSISIFAIYSPRTDGTNQTVYQRVFTTAIPERSDDDIAASNQYDFQCQDIPVNSSEQSVIIQEGDVLGACIDKAEGLDMVSSIGGYSLLKYTFGGKGCSDDKKTMEVMVSSKGPGKDKTMTETRLHLYAVIGTNQSATITPEPEMPTLKPSSTAVHVVDSTFDILITPTAPSGRSVQPSITPLLIPTTAGSEVTMSFTVEPSETILTTVAQVSTPIVAITATTVAMTTTATVNSASNPFLNLNYPPAQDINLENLTLNFTDILDSLDDDEIVTQEVGEFIVNFTSDLLERSRENFEKGRRMPENYDAGSTLLRALERFTLLNHNKSNQVERRNIAFMVQEIDIEKINETTIPLIDSKGAKITIPREVLSFLDAQERVRVASVLLRNMSGFLPPSLNEDVTTTSDPEERVLRLASPVISASVQCDNCTISNLTNPVEVSFTHLPYDKELLKRDMNGSIMCVFWKYTPINREKRRVFTGRWSKDGCETVSNSTSTVCRCNHLTHFAILLSARPLQLPQSQTLALQVIGYVGVSVSLIAMAAVIFVFLFLKPLRTMRNYIHIQLCVSLGIAQIIFVAGVEPRLGEGKLVGGFPVGCRLVAVLLHYWFLVSFMWMLMEGVVLYVALVRVFTKYHGRYIAAFTIASYGLPLIYVGGLTVPLGFVRTSDYRQNQTYDYGYKEACYLNPQTSFIWSVIAPVILIFIANIGFFIMAIVIMYKHQKRQHTEVKAHKVKHWLKVSVSLTVVMGITWIIGVLAIDLRVDALLPIAYIFTIFVAFQGLFIFVIFVLFSKQVRDNYGKWWKAKVAESDFLSRHFSDKSITTTQRVTFQKASSSAAQNDKRSKSEQSFANDLGHSEGFDNALYMDHKPSALSLSASSYTTQSTDLPESGGSMEMATVFSGDDEGRFYSNSMYLESKKQI